MKRLISLLLFITLCCAVQASARMNAYIAGSVVSASCGITDSQSSYPVTTSYMPVGKDATPDYIYVGTSFTAAGTGTYNIRTAYVYLNNNSATKVPHTLTFYLCPISSTVPVANASCTAASATLSSNDITTSYAEYKFQFAAPGFELTNGTQYAIKIHASDGLSASDYPQWGYDAAVTGQWVKLSPDDTNWETVDGSAQAAFKLTTCVE